ncbi:MAG: tyrosine-type recombinase/integrase [Faecalibacterium sp.]
MASIKQLNERKFKITISNGYLANGKKIAKAKTITVPNEIKKKAILQYVNHQAELFECEVKLGYSEEASMTFRAFAEQWLTRQTKYKPSTLANYARGLTHIYPYIGEISLEKLRPAAIEQLLAGLRTRQVNGKSIKETTVLKYRDIVSVVLSDAKRNQLILHNPAQMVQGKPKEHLEQKVPTKAELAQFIAALEHETPCYRVYYLLAMFTGCRRGELCALRWSDVVLADTGAKILIRRARTRVVGQGIIESTPKNGKARSVFLTEEMLNILRAYRAQQLEQLQVKGGAQSEYLFVNAAGELMQPDCFTNRFRKICDALSLPKAYHLHSLRHNYVTTLLHAGVDKQTVASLVGHADTGFLERTYCHPDEQYKQAAASCLGAVLFGSAIELPEKTA